MSEQQQFDFVLKALENPVRRKIIKRLSQEPSYPLELAKEIGEAQQLVTSHLAVLEKAGLVSSSIEASPIGPNRRAYHLNTSGYITLSFGPHLFNEQYLNFQTLPSEISSEATDFMKRISDISAIEGKNKLAPFSSLLKDIDNKLGRLEEEKTVLLFIRNLAMNRVSQELKNQEKTRDERRIMQFILDKQDYDIEGISKALNLQESFVRLILEKIKKDMP